MKQYMPKKPIKWGFKLWVLATSDPSASEGAGYVLDFDVYAGSQGVSEEGLTQTVVLKLLEPPPDDPSLALGKGYFLFVDNYYTSGTPFFLLLAL